MARQPVPNRMRRNFARPQPQRTARETVLIVCEGEKTEPNYLASLVHDLGLTGADVRIFGKECGSDPKSVVKHALDANRIKYPYDYVFCVIDTDSHANLQDAKNAVPNPPKRGTKEFSLVISTPCFEYWYILHFGAYDRPFAPKKGDSVCDCCIKELAPLIREHCPELGDYRKSSLSLYASLKSRTSDAIRNATRRSDQCAIDGSHNPSTQVHLLVQRLRTIAAEAVA
ncbi:RloB family protein [Brevundimonas sp.]|uniref:RloB family protein n=1 Tax=Brevundimonas sp. TaxID=1871086 RepID=UPI003A102D08